MPQFNRLDFFYVIDGILERCLSSLRKSNANLLKYSNGNDASELIGSTRKFLRDYYTNSNAEYNIGALGNEWIQQGMPEEQVKERLISSRTLWDKMEANWDDIFIYLQKYMLRHGFHFEVIIPPKKTNIRGIDDQIVDNYFSYVNPNLETLSTISIPTPLNGCCLPSPNPMVQILI